MDNLDSIETNDLKLSQLDYPKIYSTKKIFILFFSLLTVYFDILYHLIVREVLVMNMYYYLYSDDEYVHEFVEDEVEYYDNDDDFVLLIQKKHNLQALIDQEKCV